MEPERREPQPPSIAFFRSACTGLSASQIFISASLKGAPAIAPMALPLWPRRA